MPNRDENAAGAGVDARNGNLRGRVAFVSGGSRGIGKAIALALAAKGVSLALCALEEDELTDAKREIEAGWAERPEGMKCVVAPLDIRDFDTLTEFADEIERDLGPVDIVVANAGVTDKQHRSIAELPVPGFREIVAVNLIGSFSTLKVFLPRMAERRRGNVIVITSLLGQKGYGRAGEAAYCSSKFGLEGLVEVAAEEYREFGVNINTVFPGVKVDTGFFDYLSAAERTLLERPEIICDAALFLCALAPGTLTKTSVNAMHWNSDPVYRQELVRKAVR